MTTRRVGDAIASYGVPTGLVSDFELEVAGVVLDDWQDELAAIGRLLCGRAQDDLWRDVQVALRDLRVQPRRRGHVPRPGRWASLVIEGRAAMTTALAEGTSMDLRDAMSFHQLLLGANGSSAYTQRQYAYYERLFVDVHAR